MIRIIHIYPSLIHLYPYTRDNYVHFTVFIFKFLLKTVTLA